MQIYKKKENKIAEENCGQKKKGWPISDEHSVDEVEGWIKNG